MKQYIIFFFKLSKQLQTGSHYEVPIKKKPIETRANYTNYELQLSKDKNDFYFKVIRKSTGTVM